MYTCSAGRKKNEFERVHHLKLFNVLSDRKIPFFIIEVIMNYHLQYRSLSIMVTFGASHMRCQSLSMRKKIIFFRTHFCVIKAKFGEYCQNIMRIAEKSYIFFEEQYPSQPYFLFYV